MIYSFNDLVYSANSFYRCIDISRYIDTQHAYEVMYSAKRRDPFIIAAVDCNAAAEVDDDASAAVEMKYRWRNFFMLPLP